MVNGLSQAAENAKSHGNRLCRGAALPSNPSARWVTQGRQRPLPYNPSPKPFFLTGISSRRSAFSAAWAARSLNVDPTRLPDYCGLGVARPHTRTRARAGRGWARLGVRAAPRVPRTRRGGACSMGGAPLPAARGRAARAANACARARVQQGPRRGPRETPSPPRGAETCLVVPPTPTPPRPPARAQSRARRGAASRRARS